MGVMAEADRDELKALLESLMAAPDFSAARANARLEVHEARCDERHAGILASLNRMEVGLAAGHTRMDKISGRMWTAAAAGLGLGVAAIGTLIVLIVTHGLKI